MRFQNAILGLMLLWTNVHTDAQAVHPLDPLSGEEIERAAFLITVTYVPTTSWGFNYIQLKEPPKADLLPYFLSNTIPEIGRFHRKAFAVVIEKQTGKVYEAIVNLSTDFIESWEELAAEYEPFTSGYESDRADEVTRNHPAVILRCRELGFEMEKVFMSDWTLGYIGDQASFRGRRLVQMFLFGENFAGDNFYAHPFPFTVIVDLVSESVVQLQNFATHNDFDTENSVGVEIPLQNFQYDQDLLGDDFVRKDIKPLLIQFPEGASYTVQGNLLQWQKFQMRIGFNGREGLVVHHLSYNDNGTVRPIMYRAALSEMVVPYGDPRPPYHRKTEFDEGGYGMGIKSSQLTENVDCLGDVYFFGADLPDGNGTSYHLDKRVCVEEQEAGILWKHTDETNHKSHVARSRRLALSYVSRVDNYDYIFYWYFYQDATVEMKVTLTGILNTNMLALNSNPTGHSTLLSPQLTAQYHQHLFVVRIDLDVDGTFNSVSTVEMVSMDEETGSAQNPYGQGLRAKVTPLTTAGEARTQTAPLAGRAWKVSNPSKVNSVNEPVAWKLIPGNTQRMLMRNDSPVRRRANFTAFDMWVTRYDDNQLFAAGDYIGQDQLEGLPKWVEENENADIVNTDIVLWHVFGLSHIPRLEDWPIMPAEHCGFLLKPTGFFNQNPGLDVPARHYDTKKKV